MNYAIMGATGQVGGATAAAVLERGAGARAIARSADKAAKLRAHGVDVAVADIMDAAALTRAFDGVDGVFVATPSFLDAEDPFLANRAAIAALSRAIVDASVSFVVYLSSIGAQRASGLGAIGKLHDLEEAMALIPVPTVALRAGWFMENYRGQIGDARESGTLPSMLSPLDLAVPMVATADIGAVAADVLTSVSERSFVIELAHRDYSSREVAAEMSAVLGRPVTATVVESSERVEMYRSWGATDGAAREMSAMIDGFNSGWIAFAGKPASRRYVTPTPLETVLRSMTPPEL